jgi:hypothetical protein
MQDLPLVWPVFHNIATFVLCLYATNEREHVTFGLLSLSYFAEDDILQFSSISLRMTKFHSSSCLSKIPLYINTIFSESIPQ